MDAGVVTSKKMAVTLLTFRMNFDADFWIAATDQTYAGEKSKVLRVRLGMMLTFPQEVRRYIHRLLAGSSSIFKTKKCLEINQDLKARSRLMVSPNTNSLWEECKCLHPLSGNQRF